MHRTIELQHEWKLGDQIGSGGFGQVFAAVSADDVEAVVKLVPKAPGADRELLFEDLSGVPNVIPVLDRGEWEEFWVLVMPRAEKSLRDLLGECQEDLPFEDAISALVHIAEALAGIAGKVVHRDLKPENVLLWEGRWCLADFGVARYAEATTAPDTHKFSMTPAYAAPEQWRNERATTATDIYAAGVIAFELFSGERPFSGPEPHDYRRQHLEETPHQLTQVGAPLWSLVAECLYKAPQARPRPENLLARLKASHEPKSDASQRLQQAYGQQVERQAIVARQQSVALSQSERRAELSRAAEYSLSQISRQLHEQVTANAPGISQAGRLLWPCGLNGAQLSISTIRTAPSATGRERYTPTIEVISYSSVTVRIAPDQHGYEGRSHSLWYCDAQEEGIFRWYETAFMIMPMIPKRGRLNPFALEPGDGAFGALSPVLTEFQVAWPFTPIDQGEESGFIERWIGWFADAAQGNLSHPGSMPERDAKGSWRR